VRNHENLEKQYKKTLENFGLLCVDQAAEEEQNEFCEIAQVLSKLEKLEKAQEDVPGHADQRIGNDCNHIDEEAALDVVVKQIAWLVNLACRVDLNLQEIKENVDDLYETNNKVGVFVVHKVAFPAQVELVV